MAPDNLTMLTKPVNFCSTPMFLLIIVCSAPKNFEARNVIRETWASNENLLGLSTKIYFLVGETENSIHEVKYIFIIRKKISNSWNVMDSCHVGLARLP